MSPYSVVLQWLRNEWTRTRASSLSRNASWLVAGQGLSILCQGAYFIALGRLLGSSEYGIFVGAAAMVSILAQYSALGSHFVFLRYVSPNHESFATYWANVLVTTFTLGSVFAALLTWLGPKFVHTYHWKLLLSVALAECLCSQLTFAAGRVFLAFDRPRLTALMSLMTNLSRALLASVMLWHRHHATAWQWVVTALLISAAVSAISVGLVTWFYGRPRFSAALFRRRAGEGSIFALTYSTGSIYDNVDKVLLGHYGMDAANGIYSLAYRVIDVACVPFGSVQLAALPRLFRKGTEGIAGTAAYALRIVQRTVPLALLTAIVLAVAAPLVPFLVGKGFSQSASALRWLCPLAVFRSLHWGAGDALTGAGHQKLRLGNHATVAAFNFAGNIYLIPRYGWLGAAWSSLATDALLVVLNWAALFAVHPRRTITRHHAVSIGR